MARRLRFSGDSKISDSPKETCKGKKIGILPLLSFMGAALIPSPILPKPFPQNTKSNKISLKYLKRKKNTTPFFAPAEWEIYKNYFLVMRAFRLYNGKVTIVASMESTPQLKKQSKRDKTFSIFRLEKKIDKWKISNSFTFRLDALEKSYLSAGQLKGGKIILDQRHNSSVFFFYVAPS